MTCLAAFGASTAMAQGGWTDDGTTVRLTTSSDVVGIGTTTVGSKVQVNGSAAVGYSASTAAPSNGLAVSGNTGIGTTTIGSKLQVNGNTAIGYSASTAAPSNGLAVSGNTGIGTTTIGSKLQVNGNTAIGYSASTAAPANGLAVSGSTGIGTNSPSEKLEVLGNIKASDTVKAGRVTIGTYMGGSTMRQATGPARVEVIGHLGVTSNAYVTGDVEVGGRVIADSIRVERVIINDWTLEVPDYVFEQGYRLRPLTELEQHVKTHKRLPDMPVTAASRGGSVDLAALNMALLRKVEELTLYVIEQDRKIAELQRTVGRQ